MPLTPQQKKAIAAGRRAKVLKALERADHLTIAELARRCFPGYRPAARANSTVRNQLRGLVAQRLVRQVARGTYQAVK